MRELIKSIVYALFILGIFAAIATVAYKRPYGVDRNKGNKIKEILEDNSLFIGITIVIAGFVLFGIAIPGLCPEIYSGRDKLERFMVKVEEEFKPISEVGALDRITAVLHSGYVVVPEQYTERFITDDGYTVDIVFNINNLEMYAKNKTECSTENKELSGKIFNDMILEQIEKVNLSKEGAEDRIISRTEKGLEEIGLSIDSITIERIIPYFDTDEG